MKDGQMAQPIERVFLFGAGASRGAGPTMPGTPPLGSELYDELVAATEMWRFVPQVWVSSFREYFEKGMEQLWNLAVTDPTRASYVSRFLHDLARFFARFRPLPGNAYQQLIGGLESSNKLDGTALATLNYECLLEQSLRPRAVNYFSYAPSWGASATCWKLHGSCTFVPESEVIIEGINFPIDKPLGLPLKVIEPDDVGAYCDKQTNRPSAFASPLAPIMAVFAPMKPVPFQPKEVMQLAAHWRTAVAGARSVVVVGVAPNVADAHVWDPLSATAASVFVVGGPNDQPLFDDWATRCRPGRPYRYLGDGFAQTIDVIIQAI